jgi:hypothetical protein
MKKLAVIPAVLAAGIFLAPTPAAHADSVCRYSPSQIVAVGPTSCAFAMVVANMEMSGAGNTFWANSPETGGTYHMHCMVEGHGSVTCRDLGGGGATVVMY